MENALYKYLFIIIIIIIIFIDNLRLQIEKINVKHITFSDF